jgi:MarR family transcriptional regulator, negative regulator of the multidrug operon emrRAB
MPLLPKLTTPLGNKTLRVSDVVYKEISNLLAKQHITISDYTLLEILTNSKEAISCSYLAKMAGCSQALITRWSHGQQMHGRIEIKRSEIDKRNVLLKVSPEGLQLVKRIRTHIDDYEINVLPILIEDMLK